MKNRIIRLCLVVFVLLMGMWLFAVNISAMGVYNGTCGENLTWAIDGSGTLTISGTGDMTNYSFDDIAPWEANDVKSVIIENGVTTIGDFAFYKCNLSNITIAESVTSIGNSAFRNCRRLTQVDIPKKVTSIGDRAFLGCQKLTSIEVDCDNQYYSSTEGILFNKDKTTLILFPNAKSVQDYNVPEEVTHIADRAFYGCQMNKITMGQSVESIGLKAFGGNIVTIDVNSNNTYYSSLDGNLFNKDKTSLIQYSAGKTDISYTVPDSVTNIGEFAFADSSYLENVIFGKNVEVIGEFAFEVCDVLTNITINENISQISEAAFTDCSQLKTVNYNGTVAQFNKIKIEKYNTPLLIADICYMNDTILDSGTCGDTVKWVLNKDGLLTIRGKGQMYNYSAYADVPWYPLHKNIISIDILNGVESIGDRAFQECANMENVSIPESVKSIGMKAFMNCKKLNNVIIPDGVTTLGNNAFAQCDSLTNVVIGNGVISIGNCCFMTCEKLKEIKIGQSVESIGESAFESCSIVEIILPASVNSISRAFSYCNSMEKITVEEDNQYFCSVDGVLYDKEMTTLIKYPENKNDDEYIILNGVETIGNGALEHCNNLIKLFLPESTMNIEHFSLAYCKKLQSIEVDYNNEWLCSENGVLFNKEKTILIYYPEAKETTQYIIPSSVTEICAYAFCSCQNLKEVIISENVEKIDSPTFNNCVALECITVNEDNQKYCSDEGVLFNKEKTQLIRCPIQKQGENYIVPDSVQIIKRNAFVNNSTLKHIEVSDNVTTIEHSAFTFCENLLGIKLPASLIDIPENIFWLSYNLSNIVIDENNQNYCSVDGVMFDKVMSTLIQYPAGKSSQSYVIPNDVQIIERDAFRSANKLKTISFPKSVNEIKHSAFLDCNQLSEVIYSGNSQMWKELLLTGHNSCLCNADVTCLGDIELPTLNFISSNQITVSGITEKCSLIVASYNKEKLVDTKVIPILENTSKLISQTGLDISGADTVKAFLWKNMQTLVPLCDSKSVSLE